LFRSLNLRRCPSHKMQIPDYIEPVVAYRAWLWDAEGVRSLNRTRWTPGMAMVAENIYCGASSHFTDRESSGLGRDSGYERPGNACSCGIHAVKHWKHLNKIYVKHAIRGEVSLWGKIVECSFGYRAQHAYPRHFVIPVSALAWWNKDVEKRLKALIAYNVDIYVSTPTKSLTDIEKVPLWVKDLGYSKPGISLVVDSAQQFSDSVKSLNIAIWPELVWPELDQGVDELKAIRDKAEPPRLVPSRRAIPSWDNSVISRLHMGGYRPRGTGLGLRTLIQILRGRR
jgi:hypothetical protein